MLRRFRTVALVVVALTAGAAAGATPALVQEARQRSDLIAAQQAQLRLAQMRLDLAAAALGEARDRFSAGLISREELGAVEAEMAMMQANLRRLAINLEEIEASGATPRDEISAPLVDGRDFVTERLRLALAEAQQRLVAAERTFEETERRHRIGRVVSSGAVAEAEAALQQARSRLAELAERQDLREEVLDRNLSAAESERRLQLIQATHERDTARRLLDVASERLRQTRVRFGTGIVSELELKRAELEVLERQVELQQIERQIRFLEEFQRRGTGPDTSSAR
jgi:outer membrane protein TolC